MSMEKKQQRFSPHLRRLLILKVWLIEKFRSCERQVTLVWAAVIGILRQWLLRHLFCRLPFVGGSSSV